MNINITDAMRKFQEECADKAAKAKADFLSITESLRHLGVSTVELSYSGSGDSGQFDCISICGEADTLLADFEIEHPPFKRHSGQWRNGEPVVYEVTKSQVTELFEEWGYDILEHLHAGWEINDGAEGTITFDCRDGTINIDHTTFYTKSEREETEL